jgi:hypothetical protein
VPNKSGKYCLSEASIFRLARLTGQQQLAASTHSPPELNINTPWYAHKH